MKLFHFRKTDLGK